MKTLIMIAVLGLGSFAHADAGADISCVGFYSENVTDHLFGKNAVAFTQPVRSGESSGDENFTLLVQDDQPMLYRTKTGKAVSLKKDVVSGARWATWINAKLKPNIIVLCEYKSGGF